VGVAAPGAAAGLAAPEGELKHLGLARQRGAGGPSGRGDSMLHMFKTSDAGVEPLEAIVPGCWVDLVAPTDAELEFVSQATGVPLDTLRQPLDPEEKSRIDVDDDVTLVIVDIPVVEKTDDDQGWGTIPLGVLLHPGYFITVCLQVNPILGGFERGTIKGFSTAKQTRFLLQLLREVAAFYLRYLYQIDRETDQVERRLRASQENRELYELLTLAKSLVYFTTSLRSNAAVLKRLQRTPSVPMYEADAELLEDVAVETQQAIEMSEIYSNILSSLMDTFASVISNNLNRVMKFLTSVTILVSVPGVVAAFYGMNVQTPLSNYVHAFSFVVGISLAAMAIGALFFWRRKYF
jgi:magnesium transporter